MWPTRMCVCGGRGVKPSQPPHPMAGKYRFSEVSAGKHPEISLIVGQGLCSLGELVENSSGPGQHTMRPKAIQWWARTMPLHHYYAHKCMP